MVYEPTSPPPLPHLKFPCQKIYIDFSTHFSSSQYIKKYCTLDELYRTSVIFLKIANFIFFNFTKQWVKKHTNYTILYYCSVEKISKTYSRLSLTYATQKNVCVTTITTASDRLNQEDLLLWHLPPKKNPLLNIYRIYTINKCILIPYIYMGQTVTETDHITR